jgi:cell division protein FtsZ
MGIGRASGENRAVEAAKLAINSPLLEVSINGAKGVLFSIAGGDDLTMFEIHDAAKLITESADPNAKIIFGTVRDEKLKKGEVKITVIASGFPENFSSVRPMPFEERTLNNNNNEDDSQTKGKIFNSMFGGNREKERPAEREREREEIQREEPPTPPEEKKNNVIIEDDEDEWGAVPAFLRRSKLK